MKLKWTTKDGRRLWIRDMSDQHLTNTIKLLIRAAASERSETIAMFITTPEPMGDGAQMAFQNEQDHAFNSDLDDYLPEVYESLEREFEKRRHLSIYKTELREYHERFQRASDFLATWKSLPKRIKDAGD
jgi:hypothetical protein